MATWAMALGVFVVTVVLVLWRPANIPEAVPALSGALVLFLVGLITHRDVLVVLGVVWNSAMTIISTFVMAAVLAEAGFFRWVSDRLIARGNGSGRTLFHMVVAFSACLTLFLNNDGSILLGTPVILGLVARLRLPRRAAFGYLLAACLIASATSPPIGVSNMANLEAMSLVHLSLFQHLRVVMLPAVVGLAACWYLAYAVFQKDLPEELTAEEAGPQGDEAAPDFPFMWFCVCVVVLVRAGFFMASLFGVPTYVVAMAGALVMLTASATRRSVDAAATLRRAPWAILAFALGMDLVVFGLRNSGITVAIAHWAGPIVLAGPLGASFLPGLLATAISVLLNNHPGLITGSVMLLDMGLGGKPILDVAYAGVVLGSDLGALLTPIGTLASLMWFHLVRQKGYDYSWREYLSVTLVVIPASFLLSLCVLYGMSLRM